MTTEDASPPGSPAPLAEARRAGRIWYVSAGFLIAFLGGSALLWFLRKPVAEQALAAWCDGQDLQCDAKFTEIDASGLTLTALKVTSGASIPAEATELSAAIRWTGLFTPEVTSVTVNGLSLQGTLNSQGLRFGGLERLAAGGGGGPAPRLDIRDARIALDTPAGRANATLNASGILPRDGTVSIRLDPGELSSPLARAEIREGRLDLRGAGGKVEAEARLSLTDARLGDYGLDGFEWLGRANFEDGADRPATMEWSTRASRVALAKVRATDLRSSGQVEFSTMPEPTLVAVLEALTGAVFDGDAATLTLSGYTFDAAHFDGELSGRDSIVSGPLEVRSGFVTGPAGSTAGFRLSGELTRKAANEVRFDGKISVDGAALDDALRTRAGTVFSLPGVLEGHAGALRGAVDRALAEFDAETGVSLHFDGKAVRAELAGDGVLKAKSGLLLSASPKEGASWLAVTAGNVSGGGVISLSGGGAPRASLDIEALNAASGGVKLEANTFTLENWSVGGRMLAARLRDIRLQSSVERLAVSGAGVLSFAGEAAGIRLAPTTISGGLDATRDDSGWRVQSTGAPCLAVDTQGLTLGAIDMQRATVDVCPVKGRFMRQGPVPGGSASLGAVSLPFTTNSGTGTLRLTGAAIDWSAGRSFTMSVRASELGLPVTLGDRTLTIAGDAPRIEVLTGRGPARITAQLGPTVFGGTLIPANVSADSFTFDGVSAASGIDAKVASAGVLITDINADPLYMPITGEFSGTVGDNRLKLTGPLSLRAQALAFADARLDLDILTLDGEANVTTRPLAFRPGGLQPHMISGRLTGLFTSASGAVDATSDFTIQRGAIAGTADVDVRGFGFQTTRLGRVENINGTIRFSDVMRQITAPKQEFTVGRVNPGIPFTDGQILFDLRAGGVLHLDTVVFPFSGGTLALAPFDWALEGGLQEQRVAVEAKSIRLDQLVEILKLPDTKASGTVSGTFPVVFEDNKVLIKDATLKADDPGGQLSYTGGAAQAAAGQDDNASLAFNALRDFRFNVLEVGIDGDLAGDLRADILLAGKNVAPLAVGNGVTVPAGQPFEFAMGFDLPIGQLIETNLGFVSQEDAIDAAKELIKTDAGAKRPPAGGTGKLAE